MTNDEFVYDFLEQSGVKGMRWGVRKSSEEVQAKREAKAQKYVDKSKELQKKIDQLPRYSARGQRLREKQRVADESAELKRQGKFTKRQKKIAIGAGAAAAALVVYGTYSSLQSGNAKRLTEKGKAFLQKRSGIPWSRKESLADPNLDVDGIMHSVVRPINPGYGKPGTKMNCRRATYAYEMRRRGYDVAATRTTNARGQDVTGAYNALNPNVNLVPPGQSGMLTRLIGESRKNDRPFTDSLKTTTLYGKFRVRPDAVNQALSLQPPGARGELAVKWRGGGGHSMAWENVKGKIVIFDTQTGKKYDNPYDIRRLMDSTEDAGITRLDGIPLNSDFLMRWLKDA